MKSARLITWEWANEPARKEPKILLLLNHRTSAETVRKIVETLYISYEGDLSDKLRYARLDKRYPADFGQIRKIPYQGRITCGHNPYLYARKVRNIREIGENDGSERLEWDEIPDPDIEMLLTT